MNKINWILAVLSLAGVSYSAQLNKQEIDRLVADVLTHQRDSRVEITQELVRSIILTESNGNTEAKSKMGARGLMQIMPGTWKDMTTVDYNTYSFDAKTNVEVGVKYLGWLVDYASRNNPKWGELNKRQKQDLIAAMYNGGPNALRNRNWNINKMPKETRYYVLKVRKNFEK